MKYNNYKTIGIRRLAKRMTNLEKGDVIYDKAFNKYANGVTRFSLAIWDEMTKHVDMNGFTKAVMTYSAKEHYKLTLTHIDGFKIVLHGVSAGYHGEGSRGTYTVLEQCGFSNPTRCFYAEQFTLKRKTKTAA